MPQIELTDRFCRHATTEAGAVKADYFDTLQKGLCLRVTAAGSKTWHVVYSRPNGQRAWHRLGHYPGVPLGGENGARHKAKEARARVDEGGDPGAEKAAQAAAMSVADLIESYGLRKASQRRSGGETMRQLRADVLPVIGDMKLKDLHRRDVQKCLDRVTDRGSPIAANRLFAAVRAMLRWAYGRGDIDTSMVEAMPMPSEKRSPRDRVLSRDEIEHMLRMLTGSNTMRTITKRIVRMCLLSGQRVSEVCGMTRDEFDLDAGVWVIPATRTKNKREHKVPLSRQAVALIQEQIAAADDLAKRKGREPSPFVFPGPGAHKAATGASVAQALRGERDEETLRVLGVAHWTVHDTRRTMATHLESLGVQPIVIGHLLNHITITEASITTQVYAKYSYDVEQRAAMDLWGEWLDGVVNGGADVIPLRA